MDKTWQQNINRKASTITVEAFFVPKIWRARRDSNPQPLGPKPSTLSVELQAHAVGLLRLGRATGFEPVISCATDRRLRPLGYARHAI